MSPLTTHPSLVVILDLAWNGLPCTTPVQLYGSLILCHRHEYLRYSHMRTRTPVVIVSNGILWNSWHIRNQPLPFPNKAIDNRTLIYSEIPTNVLFHQYHELILISSNSVFSHMLSGRSFDETLFDFIITFIHHSYVAIAEHDSAH